MENLITIVSVDTPVKRQTATTLCHKAVLYCAEAWRQRVSQRQSLIRHCEPPLQALHEDWNHRKGARQSAFFRDLTLEGSALSQILFTTYVSKVLE